MLTLFGVFVALQTVGGNDDPVTLADGELAAGADSSAVDGVGSGGQQADAISPAAPDGARATTSGPLLDVPSTISTLSPGATVATASPANAAAAAQLPRPGITPSPTPVLTSGSTSPSQPASTATAASSSTSSTAAPTTAEVTVATTTSTVAPTTPAQGSHNGVELEVFRLTNALRADPSGPLAREKPMPSCVSEEFYGIAIDQATGHPRAVPALTLDEAISVNLARDWSIKMNAADDFSHRPGSQAAAVYDQLGIVWSATGENIAWFRGFPDSEAATIFFEGWRESDTGHYCALVAGTFTHIGVGYHKGSTSSWGTQNFYRPR